MDENGVQIDERSHEVILKASERLKYALLALFLGFLLINMVSFWMFPGIGIGGFYLFSSAHSIVSFIGDVTNITIIALLAIFGVFGWFRGKYFTDRLKGYIHFWKFW